MVIPKVARSHHAEGANGRQRAGLRASERIGTLSHVVHDLALRAARQVEIAHEYVAGMEAAGIVFTVGPPRVLPGQAAAMA